MGITKNELIEYLNKENSSVLFEKIPSIYILKYLLEAHPDYSEIIMSKLIENKPYFLKIVMSNNGVPIEKIVTWDCFKNYKEIIEEEAIFHKDDLFEPSYFNQSLHYAIEKNKPYLLERIHTEFTKLSQEYNFSLELKTQLKDFVLIKIIEIDINSHLRAPLERLIVSFIPSLKSIAINFFVNDNNKLQPNESKMLPVELVEEIDCEAKKFNYTFVGIKTIDDFITLQNKNAADDNAGLVSGMSSGQLKHIIKDYWIWKQLLTSAKLNATTFNLLLDKLSYEYLKKGIDIPSKNFSWYYLLYNIPSAFVPIVLFKDKSLSNEVSSCRHLGDILNLLDKQEHQKLYDELGSKLFDIVKDIRDMRDIAKQFHLPIFQRLGYKYVARLIDSSHYLTKTLPTLPKQERFSFLELIGFDKIRSFIHGKWVQEFFKIMPPDTHEFLKKTLFLYEIKIDFNGSKPKLIVPKQEANDLDLSNSKTHYHRIINPIKITKNIVMGNAYLKDSYGPCTHLIVFNTLEDRVESLIDKSFDVLKLIDKEEKIVVAHEWKTKCYYQLSLIDGKLSPTKTAFAQWQPHKRERFNDMTPLPDGTWMILSQEEHNLFFTGKGWHIDILDTKTFTLSRKLNVHRNQYHYMTRLTLLPDGKTVLAWDTSFVTTELSNGSKTYSICLINTDDYSVQCIDLPIDPKEVPGEIKQIKVQDSQIEIEICVRDSGGRHGCIESTLYYSFAYQDLRLKNDSKQPLQDKGKINRDNDSIKQEQVYACEIPPKNEEITPKAYISGRRNLFFEKSNKHTSLKSNIKPCCSFL